MFWSAIFGCSDSKCELDKSGVQLFLLAVTTLRTFDFSSQTKEGYTERNLSVNSRLSSWSGGRSSALKTRWPWRFVREIQQTYRDTSPPAHQRIHPNPRIVTSRAFCFRQIPFYPSWFLEMNQNFISSPTFPERNLTPSLTSCETFCKEKLWVSRM